MSDNMHHESGRRRSSRRRSQVSQHHDVPISRSRSRRRHHNKPPHESVVHFITTNKRAFVLVTASLVALLAEMPWVGRPLRSILLRVLVVLLLSVMASIRPVAAMTMKRLTSGPWPWMLALAIWCVGETIISPAGFTQIGTILRPFAVAEALRIVLCVELFVFSAYFMPVTQFRVVATSLLSIGSLVALLGLISSGQEWSTTPQAGLNSVFGNHEQFGSYILMLLPAAIILALRKSSSQALTLVTSGLTIILSAGLLYARTRSCWIGIAIAAIAMVILMVRYNPTTINAANKFLIVGPALVILIGFVGLSMTGDLGTVVRTRASTFSSIDEDKSLSDRLHRWKAACRMAFERPVAGWGLGSYPVLQQRWTGTGDTPDTVIEHGTGHQNIAHNFWVQWAAETGGVGLMLYVAMVIAFLIYATRSLASGVPPESGSILIIGAVTVIAASVDMLGSPSYSFPGVSSLPWLWMGLAVGGALEGETMSLAEPERTPVWAVIVPVVFAALVLAAILWVGHLQPGAIRL